jgi:hypothetical protein
MIEIDVELGPVKRCPRCTEWWPADKEFFYASHTRSGLQAWCKTCWHEYMDNPERKAHRAAYAKAWNARKRASA